MKGFTLWKGKRQRVLEALRAGSALPTIRLLLLQDSPDDAETAALLSKYDRVNFQIEWARTTDECLHALNAGRFDLLLLDDSIPGDSRLALLRRLAAETDAPPVIILTGRGDEAAEAAIDCGAYALIHKDSTEYLTLGCAVHQSLLHYHREAEEGRARAELERLTVIDGLTGLHNRRYLLESLDKECRRARRYATEMSLLMIDLDDFRLCNDRHGHREGDEMLRRVAALIKKSVRDTDVVARYGGDDFCVLLPETDYDGAMQLAERLRFEVAAQRLVAGKGSEPMTVSIGVYNPTPRGDLQPEEVVAHAEAALQEAKASGKNKVCGRSSAAQRR